MTSGEGWCSLSLGGVDDVSVSELLRNYGQEPKLSHRFRIGSREKAEIYFSGNEVFESRSS